MAFPDFKKCNKKGRLLQSTSLCGIFPYWGGGGVSPIPTTGIWRIPLRLFFHTINLHLWIGAITCKVVVCEYWSYFFWLTHLLRNIVNTLSLLTTFCLFSKFSLTRGQKELLLFHYLTFQRGCCCRCYLIAASKHRTHPLSKYHCRQINQSWITFLLDFEQHISKT